MVKHPWMRKELFETLRTLSDVHYQQEAWVHHRFPPGIQYDSFDYAVHFLFDDTTLAAAPENNIGWILEDQEEARAVRKVTQAIDNLLNELGTELSDAEYINSPHWTFVVQAADNALTVLNKKPA